MKYPPIVKVDEHGKVVGPISYRKAHPLDINTSGPRHTTTNILIFKDSTCKKVLISLRSNIFMGNRWDSSAGGHILWINEKGKAATPEETAYKEVNEELFSGKGVPKDLRLEEICTFWKRTRLNDHELVHLFSGIYNGQLNHNSKEVSKVKFIGVDKLLKDTEKPSKNYTNSVGVCIRKYLECMPNR